MTKYRDTYDLQTENTFLLDIWAQYHKLFLYSFYINLPNKKSIIGRQFVYPSLARNAQNQCSNPWWEFCLILLALEVPSALVIFAADENLFSHC